MRDVLKWVVLGGLFLLPLTPLVVTGSMFFSYITGKNFAFRIIVEIVTAAWLLLALYDAKYRPRFSWILASLAAFVGVIFVADLFGETPAKSFWSNFERMEGWVTLIHLLAYFIVLGSMLRTEKLWTYFLNTWLASAFVTSVVGLGQVFGFSAIAQSGVRIEARLGNAIYMAAYMLFCIFIALILLARAKAVGLRWLYGGAVLLFAFLLVETGTRGTLLGLVCGLFATAAYYALFSPRKSTVRKVAVLGMIALALSAGLFYAARNSAPVTRSPILNRIASISLSEGTTRFTIWGIALEGVKERPILGWGQSNFDYVFDKYYKPSLYAQEAWFDRVHDIVLDWLIAGGIVGFLAYAAVWVAAFWMLGAGRREKPAEKKYQKRTETEAANAAPAFSVVERGLLVGLLVGYAIHNIFVFDNLVSYMLFATMLAFMHASRAREIPYLSALPAPREFVLWITAPLAAAALILCLYFGNTRHIAASRDLIDAIMVISAAGGQQLPAARYNALLMEGLDAFKSALSRHSFAGEEIREQLADYAGRVYGDERASPETKKAYVALAESELRAQLALQPKQARMHTFLSTLYRTVGEDERALAELAITRTLSPQKQITFFDIGIIYINRKEYAKAEEIFRQAFELAPDYDIARAYYLNAAIHEGDDALVAELSAPPYEHVYRDNDLVLQAYYEMKQYEPALAILNARIVQNPSDFRSRVSKAVIQHESGDTPGAVATLRQAGKDLPEFKAQTEQFIAEITKNQ
jgi:O-antigen ligase/Tfp pilus assembly protein PilF